MTAMLSCLHVHCGDSSAETLRRSGVEGDVIAWSELPTDGPFPVFASAAERRSVRADFLSASTGGRLTPDGCQQHLEARDAALDRAFNYAEVVLWFDACLYDQLHLIRQLDFFGGQELGATRLSLICVGEFPGRPRFLGLGELSPAELASLLPTRHTITAAEFALARRAWAAFQASTPAGIEALLHENTTALPYLADALRRHLEQFPSVRNGLSRLENAALDAVAGGHTALSEIFAAVSAQETRPYFGDTSLWWCLDQLAQAKFPALAVDGPGRLPLWEPPRDLRPWTVRLTRIGEALRRGDADWIRLNGCDAWRGGVHLRPGTVWRWDESTACLRWTGV